MKVLAVGSGKGGVGKSTVAINIALALAAEGSAVGLLDADLYGPSIPLMVGIARTAWTQEWTLAGGAAKRLQPLRRHGIAIMSAGFILAEDQPNVLGAFSVQMLIHQLVKQTDWGTLDILVIDLPPGTADVQQAVMKSIPINAALIVVTPQDVAHLDGRKAISMFAHARIPIAGAVENMSGLRCPHCGEVVDVFPRVDAERSIWAMGVEKLGSIPLDPQLAGSGDHGFPLLLSHPDSESATVFRAIAGQVRVRLAR